MNVQNNPPGNFPVGIQMSSITTNEQFNSQDLQQGGNSNDKVFEKYYYESSDTAPYRVHIELIDSRESHDKELSKLYIGQLLEKKLKVNNITDTKKFGRKTITVYFNNHNAANSLTDNENLKTYGLKAYIPGSYLFVTGVIRRVDLEVDLEDLQEELKKKYAVHKIERMTRIDPESRKRTQTNSVRIVFRANKIPDYVVIYYTKIHISPFVGRVKQCKKCFRFGHYQDQCKTKEQKCGKAESHDDGMCLVKCVNCGRSHASMDQECLEFKRQKNIKYLMAKNNVGYYEAMELYPTYTNKNQFGLLENLQDFPELPARNSYSNVAKNSPRSRVVYRETKRPRLNPPAKESTLPVGTVEDHLGGKPFHFENPHKTSELERTVKMLSQSQNKINNSNNTVKWITETNTQKTNSLEEDWNYDDQEMDSRGGNESIPREEIGIQNNNK